MSKKRKSFWERYAYNQLSKAATAQESDDLYRLTVSETEALRKIRKATLFKACLAGVFGVILLYLPYHIFGSSLFPERQVWIPLYNNYLALEIEFLIYSLILVIIEIYYLTYLNIKSLSRISKACGMGDNSDPNFEMNIDSLVAVGLEKKQKQLESIGINPYEGLSKWAVFTYQILLKLKAAATGYLFKLLVIKTLGRYALRVIVDFAGIPIYAFWNAWGANRIMNEARVRVMAPPLIRMLTDQLYEEQKDNPEFKSHVFDTLQVISTSKRNFHDNHYLLAISMMERFDVDPESDYDPDFLEKISDFSNKTRASIAKLLVFGILIDGRLSMREKRALNELNGRDVLPYSFEEINSWARDYFEGRGLESLIKS